MSRTLSLSFLSAPLMHASAAFAQANPTANEPTLGGRLGGWLPFLLILAVAALIYRYRRRRAAAVDPTSPTGTRLDPEH